MPPCFSSFLSKVRTGTQVGPSLRHEGAEITGTKEDAVAELESVFAKAGGGGEKG